MPRPHHFQLALAVGALLYPQLLLAQSTTLPAPSRTVYKCTVEGKIVYTDDPCVGAKRVDVEPTRGLNKSSGRELTGRDVAQERQTEQFAEAVKPITGLTPQQFEVERSRVYLAPEAKSECARLDRRIAQAEAQERTEPIETKPAVQRQLFALRKRHREMRC
jgi:hypothetical protein